MTGRRPRSPRIAAAPRTRTRLQQEGKSSQSDLIPEGHPRQQIRREPRRLGRERIRIAILRAPTCAASTIASAATSKSSSCSTEIADEECLLSRGTCRPRAIGDDQCRRRTHDLKTALMNPCSTALSTNSSRNQGHRRSPPLRPRKATAPGKNLWSNTTLPPAERCTLWV